MYSFPSLADFENQDVQLSELSAEHSTDLWNAVSEDGRDLFEHLFFGPFENVDDVLKWTQRASSDPHNVTYAIRSRRLQRVVGTFAVTSVDTENGSAEIGSIWCGVVAQGTEIVPSTVWLVLAHLFDQLHYRRAVWKCDVTNLASRRAAEKMGFTYEGTFRKHMIIRNRSRDTSWYAVIDDDWATVATTLDRRIRAKRP
jgi:RimJ/RimL family protein N-acetyltransferase